MFQREGLSDIDEVKEAIADYHEETDRIGQFVAAWIEADEFYELRTSAVYQQYTEWCEKHHYRPENSANFNSSIQRFFKFAKKRPRGGGNPTNMLLGCKFREYEAGEEEPENKLPTEEFEPLIP